MRARSWKVEIFRAVNRPVSPLVMPNIGAAGTAKAMAQAGFDAIATTSGGLALENGVRDGEMGRQASLEVATAICAAVDIPVSADLENGFHDEPLECGRLMEAAIRAGLAGASIRSEEHTSELQSLMRISYAVFFLKKQHFFFLFFFLFYFLFFF